MNENLNQFHKWITENCDNYVSMVLIGSVATGDQWIDGRSDIDILIIFENLENNQKEKIKDYLLKADFNDVYTFVPMTKEYWLNNKNHSHDFSGKFRSKIIFGENIIDQKQIPNKETAFKIYNAGLEDVKIGV